MKPDNNPQTPEDYEESVRRLRENVFGEIDDDGWCKVRENWMKPENVKWLKDQAQNELANP